MENNKQATLTKPRFFIILILVLIGIALCVELSYVFYKTNFLTDYAPSFCAMSDFIDCDGVAKTPYSLSLGVPNSLWGMFLYLIILMLLFVDKIQNKFKNTIFDVFENPRSYIATLGMLSFGVSIILACISIFKIEKICTLCFCTYFVNFFIAVTAKGEKGYLKDFITTIKDFIKGAKKYFVLFIIVLIGFISALIYFDNSTIFSPYLKRQKQQKEFFEATVNKYAVKGNVLGKENAPVVINVYSDYNCPFCRVVNIMVHKAAKSENIIVNEINYPLNTACNKTIGMTLGGHEAACIYSQYALAAKKQGKFWGVANILFDKQPRSLEHLITELKKANIIMDYEQLLKDANSEEIKNELQKDIQLTKDRGVYATPTIEINGEINMGAIPYDELIKKIREAEKKAKNN